MWFANTNLSEVQGRETRLKESCSSFLLMAGVISIDAKESLADLAEQLRQVETLAAKEPLQVRTLAETGQHSEYQCDCQSSRKTLNYGATPGLQITEKAE